MRLPEAFYVIRTMQALEVVAHQPASAPQVAEILQVHPRTARRLLSRLHEEGWLTRSADRSRRYAPTLRIVALAGQVLERAPLVDVATRYVSRLHDRTDATAHLAIPSYRSALCVLHAANGAGVTHPQVRELLPCHCTAAGKALLSWRDEWRESVLSAPLERHTERTLVDPDAVRADVAGVRIRGYAIEDGEFQSGVRAVAAPVFSPDGEAVAALSVSTGGEASLAELVTAVRETARDLMRALEDGWTAR